MKTNTGHKKFRPQHDNRKQTAFRFYNSTSETLPFKKNKFPPRFIIVNTVLFLENHLRDLFYTTQVVSIQRVVHNPRFPQLCSPNKIVKVGSSMTVYPSAISTPTSIFYISEAEEILFSSSEDSRSLAVKLSGSQKYQLINVKYQKIQRNRYRHTTHIKRN